jgi:hypothetical protein
LKNQTPDAVHQSPAGGGAMFLEKYGAVERLPISLCSTGTVQHEAGLEKSKLKPKLILTQVTKSAKVRVQGFSGLAVDVWLLGSATRNSKMQGL